MRNKQDTNPKSESFVLLQIMAGRVSKNPRASPLNWSVRLRLVDLSAMPESNVARVQMINGFKAIIAISMNPPFTPLLETKVTP